VSISFSDLRAANVARLPLFKNALGEPAHTEPDGSDWSDSDWIMAVTGELGELANLRKKVLRGDLTMEQAMPELADELADVATYLDILAMRMGVDLGEAVRSKFNRVSQRVGCNVTL
jgi:NTP pyrophosphatase (non-canonical NTP hydrolase)